MTKYKWAHVNSIGPEALQLLLPRAEVITDGDCGSVWGEHHDELHPCPHPHVLVKNPTLADLDTLKRNGVPFYADPTPEWGEGDGLSFHWTEDTECPERTMFLWDYRTPYGEPSRKPAYIVLERQYSGMLAIMYPDQAAAEASMDSPFIDGLCEEDCLDCDIRDYVPFRAEVIIAPID